MVIKVTKEHIKNGVREASSSCPVALALRDAGFKGAGVGLSSYWLAYGSKMEKLPKAAKEFVWKFDSILYFRSWRLKPFEFEINDA